MWIEKKLKICVPLNKIPLSFKIYEMKCQNRMPTHKYNGSFLEYAFLILSRGLGNVAKDTQQNFSNKVSKSNTMSNVGKGNYVLTSITKSVYNQHC